MKQYLRFAVLFMALLSLGSSAFSQQTRVGCVDKNIRLQADEIKQHYVQQGFTVFRDAMISMESMSPAPVVVQLTKGQLYQVIFVANENASKMRLEIFNGRDQKIEEKTASRNREQPNFIQFSFIPNQSDNFLFVLMQKWKAKDVCGSFCILKANAEPGKEVKVKPYTFQ